jgi:hypothetical protein
MSYPELEVLPIRQIEELAVLLVRLAGHQAIAALVLPVVVSHEHQRHHNRRGCGGDDGDLGWDVLGRVFLAEGEWSNNVADT